MAKALRWLLVPVSAAAVVGAVATAGRWAVTLADRRCPVESLVGGACVEPWHTSVVEAAIFTGVLLAALGLVIVPALVAPQLKRSVAVVAFIIAAGAVGYLYFTTRWADMLVPSVVAVASSALALTWVCSWRISKHA